VQQAGKNHAQERCEEKENYQIVGETGASEKGSSWMENIAGVLLTQKNEVARGGFQMVDSAFANSGLLLSPSSGV
jgi:hypothetical protein